MFDFYEKRKIRSIVYSRPMVVFLVLLSLILSISVYHRYVVAKDMEERLKESQTRLDSLHQRAELLQSKVEYMEDERGIEEELRNRFDVIKEGEQVIVLIDDRTQKESSTSLLTTSEIEEATTSSSFFEKLKFW